MDKHCKGCKHFHSAGRKHPKPEQKKFNGWCTKKGAPVNVGWCKLHNAKELVVARPGGEHG